MDSAAGTDDAPLRDLDRLLASLDPALVPGLLAYAALPPDAGVPAGLEPFALLREDEGTTVIAAPAALRDAGLEPVFPCRRIVLRVRSALEAVGLTAAVASALAEAGIPCNVVAAFHHDHLLVPAERADEALARLRTMVRSRPE